MKVNAAAMHAMAMMIGFFMICDGCGVFCWSARSRPTSRISEPAPLRLELESKCNRGFHCIRFVRHWLVTTHQSLWGRNPSLVVRLVIGVPTLSDNRIG